MGNIIGFCGRQRSGKTELSKICEEFGYKRLYFAEPLKRMISTVLSCTIDELNEMKTAEIEYKFGEREIEIISRETDIPSELIREKLDGVTFHNTREIMQVIGTDIIREYNHNWHVNKIKEVIKEGEKYVIDDVRFQNEANMIGELGGDLWFVTRPILDCVSKHASENSLSWQEIDNIIVNDKSLEYLLLHWRIFMENGYEESLNKRKKVVHDLYEHIIENANEIVWDDYFTVADSLMIHKDEFLYNYTWDLGVKEVKLNDDKTKVIVTYEDGSVVTVDNALQIEDCKRLI